MPATSAQPIDYWSQPVEALAADLGSGLDGLGSAEALGRLARVGPNSLHASRRTGPIGLFLNQFRSPIILILLFATGVSAFLRDWVDASIILVIVFGSALLSFLQEYRAGNATARLQAQTSIKANVLRDGKPVSVPAEEIVPGDVVLLAAGSLIPADGRILEAKDFYVSQAVLTGETFPVERCAGAAPVDASLAGRENSVFMGTSVRSGTAKVLVARTGSQTAFGEVAQRLSLRPPATEFERGIRRLGYLLSEITLLLVLAVFAANVFFHKPILDSLLFSLALAVGLTPQLLPAIININLSKGAQDMAAGGVIVRRLASIENFGSMDVLCTDKTGTLTEGVVGLGSACDPEGQESGDVLRWAFLNASLQTGLANPLDEAIIATAAVRKIESRAQKIDEVPYDFVRKRLSVVVTGDPELPSGAARMITKGAFNNVAEVCTELLVGGGRSPLGAPELARLSGRYAAWSEQGYRVLGLATRDVEAGKSYDRWDETGMCFVGFLLFSDPPKQGVLETVADLERLGVRLCVITGDNKLVALHTAKAIGLEVTGVLTGSELNHMNDEALWGATDRTNLFAEVDPNQKERIILAQKKLGHVVGYLGDGINDAPALHAADVGISVETAVDVAKDAADFVLLQHDLGILREGIAEGRRTFANSLKYVFMATSANFGNMFSVAGASLFLPYLPMLPKQILLINFLTDLPEMSIASDNVDREYVERPHRWDINFIRRFMLVFGPLSSIFDLITFGVLLLMLRADQAQFHTGWFLESVISATMIVFALRTRLPFLSSHPSKVMIALTAGAAAVAMYIPYSPLAGLLGFVALPAGYLLVIAGITILYFLAAEWAKRIFYRHAGR